MGAGHILTEASRGAGSDTAPFPNAEVPTMRGKHRRRRPPPGPITRSSTLAGVLVLSLAVPHPAGGPSREASHRRARLSAVFAAPVEITAAIADAGYDSCSTASNHSLDGGATGIDATLDALDRAGLAHAGTARTRAESRHITMLDVDGAHVAHLAASFGFNGFTPEHERQANLIEVERILEDARRARERGSDFTVVSLHWGVEGVTTPTAYQTEIAERLTRSRFVDAIVGHHAHVVQPVERVHGKVVAYGLGNFLSGMRPSKLWPDGVEDGVIVVLRVERRDDTYRVTKVRAVPTTVEYGTWRILPAA